MPTSPSVLPPPPHRPGQWQGVAGQALAVILGVGAAMGLRALMTPWLGEDLAPFITAFPVVAAVAFFAAPWVLSNSFGTPLNCTTRPWG